MLESLRVIHYRGFADLEIQGLGRVNLIAGRNNVGKTALLEAIQAHLVVNPQILALRTLGESPRSRTDSYYINRWEWLFHDCDVKQPIVIQSNRTDGRFIFQLELEEVGGPVSIEEPFEPDSSESGYDPDEDSSGSYGYEDESYFFQLSMQLSSPSGIIAAADCQVIPGRNGERLKVIYQNRPQNRERVRFESTRRFLRGNDARLFDELVKSKRVEPLLKLLRRLDPRVLNMLSISQERFSTLHVDLGIERMVPITMLGEGFNRITSILLAISACKNGVVLIDEIENGIHYSVLEQVWRAIAEAARAFNVQVFLTTHSWECIRAAHSTFENESEYDLRLLRLDRDPDQDRITATVYDQEMIDASLKSGLEMR